MIVDVVGGGTVAAFVGVFVWLTLVQSDGTALEVSGLRHAVKAARQDLARTRATRDRLLTELASRQAELAKTGRLPDQAPVDEYFQTLSQLAASHALRVVSHQPRSSRSYPGLFEQRYAYQVTGSALDLVHFFRAIEGTEYWADVSHFKVDRGRGPAGASSGLRTADLTLSLFSALPTGPAQDSG